jgi:2-polyprenyl-3-methyl-5-hydroxy-6-metoxy-1,4-benzoquinol methylase
VGESSSKAAEQAWHDDWYGTHALQSYHDDPRDFMEDFRRVHLSDFCDGGWSYWADARRELFVALGDVRNLRVLDYGCGHGQLGVYLALQGAEVAGFDLSPKAVEIANSAAQKYGLQCSFDVQDAENLSYPDASFDSVIGFGVIHHVIKYPRSAFHLRRVLKTGGRAIFHETLWSNPFISLARRFTSEEKSAGDSPITLPSIRKFFEGFSRVDLVPRHCFYMLKRLASLPERNLAHPLRPRPFWKAIKKLDSPIARLLPSMCGEVIISAQR